ncbi:bifunctional DNA primase/polymerase [Actinomadura sp. NBRC 104425]|uniref:bifunctional DNA primase/polymerase n=1 Tax=Actinomadura sp. NBRC 104425 TaxID=3032204 RepID=UPI00255219BE|nr:bifunctional DNA primase/polymerase [Actinomadura sp. NBRC 104425]
MSSVRVRAALDYAARGWPVFPCKPGSKEPATAHGFHDATTDPEVIRWWWQRIPAANVAIATGAPAVDVLDVDVKAGGTGYAAFNRLKRAGMLAGALALVQTPSGGLHTYFAGTGQRCGALKRHFLDFKATGGYVLAPPSTVGGRAYELLDRRDASGVLDWPSVTRLLDPPRPAAPRPRRRSGDIARLAAWMARQPEGNRNSALFWAACRAAEEGQQHALDELVNAAVHAGLDEREARRTVQSAQRRIGGAA